VVVSLCAVFFLRDILFPTPTCFDHKKNGYEVGIDCGGTCALRCTEEVNPLSIVWAKAIHTGRGLYDLVALVTNSNIDNASQELGFTFSIYGDKGELISTFSGSTTAPLDGKFPIIVPNVPLGNVPSNVTATLTDGPHYTVIEKPSSPTVRITDRRFEQGSISRVYATIVNTKQLEITDLPVRVLLYDDKDNVYADGQTIVPRLPKEGVKEIIFTWQEPLPFPPTRIGIYPIFNPFDAIGY
jgi:hypothetical protein